MLLFQSLAVEFGPDRICKFWECRAPSWLWRRTASWTGRTSVPAEASRGCLMSFLPYIMRWGSASSEQIVRWSLLMSRQWSIFQWPRMLGTFSTHGVRRGLALLRSYFASCSISSVYHALLIWNMFSQESQKMYLDCRVAIKWELLKTLKN